MYARIEEVSSTTVLPTLRARLKAARTRARAAAMLRGTVFGTMAALVLLCGLELFALYSDAAAAGPLAGPFGWLSFLGPCLAVFAGALVLAIVLAFLLTPDAATLARAAERTFALQERLSTALEVEAHAQRHAARDPVRLALLADAERSAAAIDPRQVVRLQWPRAGWTVPVLVAVALLLQLGPPDATGLAALRGSPSAARDDAGLAGGEAAAAAANLRRIAELLGRDADERSDQYLRSIARALERLGLDVERTAVDRRILAGKLENLVAHARQAYGEGSNAVPRTAPRDIVQQLQAALDDIAGNRGVATASPRPDADEPQSRNDVAAPQEHARRPAPSPERTTPGAQTASVAAPQDQRAAGWDAVLKDLDDYDLVDPRTERERAFAEQQRRARAAAQSAGPAKDAGAGEGDRAGEGTRPLGNGSTALNELAPGAEMLLPDPAAGNGRRIRIELAPKAALSGVEPPLAGNDGAWQRGAEQTVEREALAPADRKVVGRYFTRPAGDHGP